MAIVDVVYADPSALLKLYLREPESRAMARWRSRAGDPLLLTHHGWLEMLNGIALAAHRGLISDAVHDAAIEALDDDVASGRYRLADLLWRATLKRAAGLSRTHTKSLGCRSLDILHVASALELGMKQFLTYDLRQAKLARMAGLKTIRPGS